MFIPRLWFDEVERIGKQRCTPLGYKIQIVGELIGFIGLLTLIGVPAFLVNRGMAGKFHWSQLWLLLIAPLIGVIDTLLVGLSWSLAYQKQFRYDYGRRVSSWVEDGIERTYTYSDYQSEHAKESQ